MPSTFLDSGECSFQLLVLITFVDTNHCSPEEKFDCYMLTAGVMTCGGIEFKTKGRDDQASRSHTSNFLLRDIASGNVYVIFCLFGFFFTYLPFIG